MKKYLFLLIIIPLLTNCGAGSGTSVVDVGNGGGDSNGTGKKPNPACPSTSNIAKVRINESGVYRVTYKDLNNICIDLSGVNPAALKMTNQGKEIAIDMVDNNHNGSFDDGDYIEFYGNAIPRGDERFRFTETNVYWLSAEGGGEGKRIQLLNSLTPQLQNPQTSFKKVLHMEEDSWYEQKNYPDITISDVVREHWFWGEVFYTPGIAGNNTGYYKRDYNFNTRYIDKTRPVSLKIRLQSASGSHHIKVYINPLINANPVVDKVWDNAAPYDLDLSVYSAFLNNGQNVLRLESVGDTPSGDYELFYLDWFDVTFYHLYKAELDALEFSGEGQSEVTNFYTPDISIYEISDFANVKKVIPMAIEGIGPGEYKIRISAANTDGQSPDMKFLALSDANKKSPLSVERYTTSDIRFKSADYVIITHKDFYDAIIPLADYRHSQDGYNVLTISINDIYDEFSYGIETPHAIKDFLTYAYNHWTTKPRFVLLVGDATVDYKDISGYGRDYGVKSYAPAYLYNYPGLGEVPSDNWFVDVVADQGDAHNVLPEMNIGRIPARSFADVSAVVNKVISHESSPKSSNAILVADVVKDGFQKVAPENEQIFEKLSDSLAGIIPNASKLYRRNYTDDFRARVIEAIDSDPLLVNYTGHGSVVDWTNDDIFSSKDVENLTNKKYPFVVALNCLNGYFVMPNDGVVQNGVKQYPSIAEAFLLAQDKGAVAVLASSAIGYPSEHDPFAKSLYGTLFNEDVTLGEAVTRAKDGAYKNNEISEDVVQTFIFFGDPATRLR